MAGDPSVCCLLVRRPGLPEAACPGGSGGEASDSLVSVGGEHSREGNSSFGSPGRPPGGDGPSPSIPSSSWISASSSIVILARFSPPTDKEFTRRESGGYLCREDFGSRDVVWTEGEETSTLNSTPQVDVLWITSISSFLCFPL